MKYLKHINESEDPLYRISNMHSTYDLMDDNCVDITDRNCKIITDFVSQNRYYKVRKSRLQVNLLDIIEIISRTSNNTTYIYQLKDEYFAVVATGYYICDEIDGVLQLLKVIM